jgi:hypothetical protein
MVLITSGRRIGGYEYNSANDFGDKVASLLLEHDSVEVNLDETDYYGVSSRELKCVFGRLVSVWGFTPKFLQEHLVIICDYDPSIVTESWEYING